MLTIAVDQSILHRVDRHIYKSLAPEPSSGATPLMTSFMLMPFPRQRGSWNFSSFVVKRDRTGNREPLNMDVLTLSMDMKHIIYEHW